MSNEIRRLAEDVRAHSEIETARSLADAANSQQSLQGYAAVNGLGDEDEIARLAYQYFEERTQAGHDGSAEGDWFRAEEQVRRGGRAPSGE